MEKEKLKIYHVLTDRNIGGAGRWLLNYLKYCDRKTYDVRVVLPADSQLCPVVESLDIPVIKMDAMADSSYDKKALAPLTELFRKDKPDVVHTHASLTARMAAKKGRCATDIPYKTLYGKCQRKYTEKTGKTDGEPSLQRQSHCREQSRKKEHDCRRHRPKQIVTIYNGIEMLSPLTRRKRGRYWRNTVCRKVRKLWAS